MLLRTLELIPVRPNEKIEVSVAAKYFLIPFDCVCIIIGTNFDFNVFRK